MSRIRSANTAPELAVRSMLHRMGYRFRLHRRDLPGNPDVVLPRFNAVVFVHGCFWHRHKGCRYAYKPKSREALWTAKFEANIERDRRAYAELDEASWHVITVWECELRQPGRVEGRLSDFLQGIDIPDPRLN
jgi:DNA mismatch endonuclease, patch repair protein